MTVVCLSEADCQLKHAQSTQAETAERVQQRRCKTMAGCLLVQGVPQGLHCRAFKPNPNGQLFCVCQVRLSRRSS